MPPYVQHVVIRTGKGDWSSKIEDEVEVEGGTNFAKGLKALVGRGGRLFDVCGYICYMVISVRGAALETGVDFDEWLID